MKDNLILLLGAFVILHSPFVISAAAQEAPPRVALVIGVSDYPAFPPDRQLTSPVHDATDLSSSLRSIGFKVTECIQTGSTPLTRKDITDAKSRFLLTAAQAPLALVYFSGHGFQVGDENYLIPGDMPQISSFTTLRENAVPLRDSIMSGLEEAGVGTKIVILDCCRDNPFEKQITAALTNKSLVTKGGSGQISGYGPGFFLAFATSPGTGALDGNGARNSPFTSALLTHLKDKAGINIRDLFDEVKSTVAQTFGEAQVPWVNDSLNKDHLKILTTYSKSPAPATTTPGMAEAEIERRAPEDGESKIYTNSLGMRFVKLLGTPLQISTFETRVSDFHAYASQKRSITDLAMTITSASSGGWKWSPGASWQQPGFPQKSTHPVVCISYQDAVNFAVWLTQKELQESRIKTGYRYRLPTHKEWLLALNDGAYFWGQIWPPPDRIGNLAGQESLWGALASATDWDYISQYHDGFPRTAPVGSFMSTSAGIYDLEGNVHEWIDGVVDHLPSGGSSVTFRYVTGGAWSKSRLSDLDRLKVFPSAALANGKQVGYADIGFRLVLAAP